MESLKQFGVLPLFDPEEGTTVVEPPGEGTGYWVGGCSAIFDPSDGMFYLYYRTRKPISEGRGGFCSVAQSSDGVKFETVWSATKEQFDSESIESASLLKSVEGKFRLYISYVNQENRKWDIALLEGDSPSEFDPSNRRLVIGAGDVQDEGVKDPYVAIVGGTYYMFVHYAPMSRQPNNASQRQLHGTGNIFATEYGIGSAGIATSVDGVEFQWQGEALPPGDSWDSKLTRVDTMAYVPPVYTVLYSGRSNIKETYEDRTGIAVSFDMKTFQKMTPDAPALASGHATGSLRYSDVVALDDEYVFYYEYARADGSHEIRMSRVSRW
ncbi:MAG: hypothetical protein QF878_07835 [SAR202 cluster bacterium]|nr:hypothetical protein [SAR202 cluster bacterium]